MTAPNLAAVGNVPPILIELRRAWLASGLTQQYLAERTGINRPNITRILSGTHMPTVGSLARVAAALGYDLALIPREDI